MQSQCMWLDLILSPSHLSLVKLEITDSEIDSFYGSIKTLYLCYIRRDFHHNVKEFCQRLFGFYFKICTRRHEGKKAWRKKGEISDHWIWMRCCLATEFLFDVFSSTFPLDPRHFFSKSIPTTDALGVVFACLAELWVSSKWKFLLMKNKSFGPLSSLASPSIYLFIGRNLFKIFLGSCQWNKRYLLMRCWNKLPSFMLQHQVALTQNHFKSKRCFEKERYRIT